MGHSTKHRRKSAKQERHYKWKAGRANAVELHIGASKFTGAANAQFKTRKLGKLGAASPCVSIDPQTGERKTIT